MAEFVANANVGFSYRCRSEHHYSDKAIKGEDVKEQCPDSTNPEISPEAHPLHAFYKDIVDPEKSLYWFAYNTNKRSITLDIEKADGKELK